VGPASGNERVVPWRSIPDLARWAAATFGDHEAIVDGDIRLSYAQLGAAIDDVARALVAAGVQPGDHVSIWAPNMAEWVAALVGSQSVGATVVPLNTRYKGAEAAYILNRSKARVLFTVSGFLGNDYVGMLTDQDLPNLRHTVVLRGDAPAGALAWHDFLAMGTADHQAEVDKRVAALGPDDVGDMMFTSGTTGHPKGVPATYSQSLRAFTTWAEMVGLETQDRYLLVNPMFHSFGYKAGILACIITGATLVPVPVLDLDIVFDKIKSEHISVLPGAPTLYQSLLNSPRLGDADLSSLRLAVTGAAMIPVQLVRRMHDELGFETVVTAYGLTETMGFVTICRPGDPAEIVATTSGRVIPDVEMRIVDDDGKELPTGDPGEVVVRGYNVMKGYFEDPGQTAETIDADGWLHTGDIGVVDDQGNLRITDRKKDMFIVGGFNAYPAEIENMMLDNDKIAQVAVVGVPDERMGEVGMAYVVLRHGVSATPEELIAWAREHMANYKAPRKVEIVDSLPLNASGKVLKFEIREQAARALEANT
jgi:acyl-CoA synthetase (AMP-forming)/AMP-acid ligase II